MNIVIFSSDTCPHCLAAKNFLSENGFKYSEKNVNTDPDARKELIALGYRGVPLLIIGNEKIVGFDEEKLKNVLELK